MTQGVEILPRKPQEAIVTRNYVFTQKELKRRLDIQGDIEEVGDWNGLSPNDEEKGVSKDKTSYFIKTTEKQK